MVYHKIIVHNLRGSVYFAARAGEGFMFTQMGLYGVNLSKTDSDKIKEKLTKNFVSYEESLVLDTNIGDNIWF